MQFKDYYETLGVAAGATDDEIKAAYRRLARKFHPDVSKESGAEEKFKAVGEAYEALRDPEKRAQYDQLRSRGFRGGDDLNAGNAQGFEFNWSGGGAPSGSAGFSDFFESLFGAGRPSTERRKTPRSGERPGTEHARIEVDLEAVFNGGRQRISVHGRTLDVRIPRGIQAGQQIRLSGQSSGGGDLLLDVVYRPHYLYEVTGREVRTTLPVAPWEAALGAELTVPTLGGPVQLRIPAGSDTGKRLRLRGRGLPATLPGDPPGDQLVIIEIHAPVPQDERQRALYRQLAEAFRTSRETAK